MKSTIVINIAGGPGTGKTTVAAKLFAILKQKGYDVENVSEFAKELVWEGRNEAFNDRLYMHAEQNHRLMQMNNKLDYIITDSPLFLTSVYNQYYLGNKFSKSYNDMINEVCKETFNLYQNKTYLLQRNCSYKKVGRREDEDTANIIDSLIIKYLDDNNIEYSTCLLENAVDLILKDLNI